MKKRFQRILIGLLLLIILLLGAFYIYASDFYRADEVAIAVMQSEAITLVEDNFIVLSPNFLGDTAIIFYPGAKVEYISYLPLMEKIKQSSNVTCILVKMPFNMAIFDSNAAY